MSKRSLTPIADFLDSYAGKKPVRFHMPGHKGATEFSGSLYDITEIPGADSLYFAEGIIAESEKNAAEIFGSGGTFYSTEGSSHCIRTMLALAFMIGERKGLPRRVLAGRNAHSSFITALGLLDGDVTWIRSGKSLTECPIDPEMLEKELMKEPYPCVYITSPDYTGNMCDVKALAAVCEKYDTLLLVDNAHGAYLRFTKEDLHPMTLGAHMCCDSAHKTLPVLTGGAYLHISAELSDIKENVKPLMSVFGSTSPSYLVLRSLDLANKYLKEDLPEKIRAVCEKVSDIRKSLSFLGFDLTGDEPMKITVAPKSKGYTGLELDRILRKNNLFCDYADEDHTVLMPSPCNSEEDLVKLYKVLSDLKTRPPVTSEPPMAGFPKRAMSVRKALFSPSEALPAVKCEGRILQAPCVNCPPCVPCAVSGEIIDKDCIKVMKYYGIDRCFVCRE